MADMPGINRSGAGLYGTGPAGGNGREGGFTLVELLVVVAIMAVIAAIALPRFLEHRNRSEAVAELAAVKLALEMLAVDTEKWPGGHTPFISPMNLTPPQDGQEYMDLTAADIGIFNSNGTVFSAPDWQGPYLSAIYLDQATGKFLDPWGTPYFMDYDYDAGGGNWFVVVGSAGPNKSGTNNYDSDNIYITVGR